VHIISPIRSEKSSRASSLEIKDEIDFTGAATTGAAFTGAFAAAPPGSNRQIMFKPMNLKKKRSTSHE
jgi:hypothetical protein